MSVEFQPAKVGGDRRRFDPLAIGVGVVVIALAVAVVKPWEAAPTAQAPGPSPAAVVASPTPSRSASPAPPNATATPSVADALRGGTPPTTWEDVAPVVRRHDAWGVRAIVAERTDGDRTSAGGRRFAERWSPASLEAGGTGTVTIDRGDSWVAALGITTPPGSAIGGVRIWWVHRGDRLEWIDARQIAPDSPDAASLYVRIGMPDTATPSWRAGQYRIDVLTDGVVRRIGLQIPTRAGTIPEPDDWPETERGLVAATEGDPSGVRSGLFATVDGVGVPLATIPGRPLDEVDAWQAVASETGGGSTPTVARAYLPRATGLGVMLTEHAFVQLAILQRLAPSPLAPAPPYRGGISSTHGRTPFVVFGAPDGEAMAPGVYAISVSWTDPAGLHAVTWHVELRPGPIPAPA